MATPFERARWRSLLPWAAASLGLLAGSHVRQTSAAACSCADWRYKLQLSHASADGAPDPDSSAWPIDAVLTDYRSVIVFESTSYVGTHTVDHFQGGDW